mgnify:CR=1 FL=1
MESDDSMPCPCGSMQSYGSCCGPIHRGGAGLGTSAEQLMRARYSAYVLENEPFLLDTWHRTTRPGSITFGDDLEWHGLEVLRVTGGGALETSGSVEFRARFRRNDARLELHELSTFVREGGSWLYVDGSDPDA